MTPQINELQNLALLIRHFILTSTTAAGSGHPTSSLSATDLMAVLFFGGFFKADLEHPNYPHNDRLIFSKGHASPLFYSLYAAAGAFPAGELNTLRKFGSRLEGHPTMTFPYTEAATGSLGQGLSIGVGMALNAKYLDKLDYRTYVLLGDSEMAEGSCWEALAAAAHYKLNNLVGIVDINRLGQRGATMYGHNVESYQKKIAAFGWKTIVIDGHSLEEITTAFDTALSASDQPTMIIAKTIKGKGVSFVEDKEGWHGKALSAEELKQALTELGEINLNLKGAISKPESPTVIPTGRLRRPQRVEESLALNNDNRPTSYKLPATSYTQPTSTRKAYGNALVNLGAANPNVVVLDAEVSNSTFAELFAKKYPDRYFEMFIAEQNMVGTALGLSRRGKIPFVSTFAAFFTRAADQIRMGQYSGANIKFCGSHAGVSIGEDGASQMGLEDIALFRAVHDSVVLYPSDAVSTEKLVAQAAEHAGMVYIRTTRKDTALIYSPTEEFAIGGSKIIKQSDNDLVTVIAAGITLHEALKAYDELQKENINIRVVDAYSVKPLDLETLKKCANETKTIITVEDHHHEGGLGEAVLYCLNNLLGLTTPVKILAVSKLPQSGKPEELLACEEIDSTAIVRKVKEVLQ